MTRLMNLSGRRFQRLIVISRAPNDGARAMWNCVCDCGTQIVVRGSALTSENTRSCGCLVRDAMSKTGKGNATHNLSRTPEYRSWARMIHRCYEPKDNRYRYYGGRGIRVCNRWRDSFEAFLADMGKKPTIKHTIDRFPDTNGDYGPGNCRWATYSQQNKNRRPFRPHTAKLSPDDVRAIRVDERANAAVARDYGVSGRQIGDVKNRVAWANIE